MTAGATTPPPSDPARPTITPAVRRGEERPSDDDDPPTLEIRPARPKGAPGSPEADRPAPVRRPRNALGPFVPELASWPT